MTDLTRRSFLALADTAASPQPLSPSREAIRKRYFPDITVQTHDGRVRSFYTDLIRDRVVTINFMYINCEDGRCPLTTHNLAMAQRRMKARVGRDIFMYSITLDPERDTIAALRGLVKSHGIGPGWSFLRASPEDTETLRKSLGFTSKDPVVDANKASHAAMIRFGNEPRQQWAAISGFAAAKDIVRAVQWVAPSGKTAPNRRDAPDAVHHHHS
jgi:protein SCO1